MCVHNRASPRPNNTRCACSWCERGRRVADSAREEANLGASLLTLFAPDCAPLGVAFDCGFELGVAPHRVCPLNWCHGFFVQEKRKLTTLPFVAHERCAYLIQFFGVKDFVLAAHVVRVSCQLGVSRAAVLCVDYLRRRLSGGCLVCALTFELSGRQR